MKLEVGTKIKIGEEYSQEHGYKKGEIIELVDGTFEHDNGLYCETQHAPSVWNDRNEEFDSIYHLFGNDLEWFMDCEIVDNGR